MQGRRLVVVFAKKTEDDLVHDARKHDHEYGGAHLRQTQGRAN
jgi:hypothetical protein